MLVYIHGERTESQKEERGRFGFTFDTHILLPYHFTLSYSTGFIGLFFCLISYCFSRL